MVTPYITFEGKCSEALEFYKKAFNSTVKMQQPYGDYVPEGVIMPPDKLKEWILHAEMEICGTIFWFADEAAEPVEKGNMVKLTVQVDTAKEAQQIFKSLNKNAHITLPPTETFYSSFHAGLVDQFGVGWNITTLEGPNQAY